MEQSPYEILKVHQDSSYEEIRLSYRKLVKIHHPDKGGNKKDFLKINAAWELIKAKSKGSNRNCNHIDEKYNYESSLSKKSDFVKSVSKDTKIEDWIKTVYQPIDKLIGQIINPFQGKIRELSADPYDEQLMNSFISYLEESNRKIDKIHNLYSSKKCPSYINNFSLNLYHCFAQVQDAINELERYTMGYVDNYLHDGKEMIKEAKSIRSQLKNDRQLINTKK